ncbi:MAG: PRC-barrel domain-containing protein [Sphingomicrobium sp.]
MRLSDLRGKKICSVDGKLLGRVHEVHCDALHVTALICGPGSVIERWTARSKGRRIPWEAVHRIGDDRLIVAGDRAEQ